MGEIVLRFDGKSVRCTVVRKSEEFEVRVGDAAYRLRLTPLEQGLLRVTDGDRSQLVAVARAGARRFLHLDGDTLEYEVASAGEGGPGTRRAQREDLTVPMPGVVAQVLVREGDPVTSGQPLVIVEAMKMEHVLRAPHRGRVRAVQVRPGQQVNAGAVVAEIDEEPE